MKYMIDAELTGKEIFVGFVDVWGTYLPVILHKDNYTIIAPAQYWTLVERYVKDTEGLKYLIFHEATK